jgi:hypothetical protein
MGRACVAEAGDVEDSVIRRRFALPDARRALLGKVRVEGAIAMGFRKVFSVAAVQGSPDELRWSAKSCHLHHVESGEQEDGDALKPESRTNCPFRNYILSFKK